MNRPNEGRRSEEPGASEQPTLHLYALLQGQASVLLKMATWAMFPL